MVASVYKLRIVATVMVVENCKSKQALGCGFRDSSGKIVSQN